MSDNLKVVLGVLGGAVVVLLVFSAFTSATMGAGIFGMLLALLFWFLVIALIVVLIVWIVQQIQR
jgi:hypothetical protein